MVAGNYFFFSIIQLFFFFGKTNSFEISVFVFRYDHISLLMYRCLLPPLLSKWITKKTWKMLNKKCNCIIMSLNTYNTNVDIIWQNCIISHIKLHCFKRRSDLTNMKKHALKYMIYRLWYGIFHITCYINPRIIDPY